jgi:hypothetical protein
MKVKAAIGGLAAAALLALGAAPASALSITMAVSVAKNPGNTADNNVTPNGNITTTSVTDAGGTDATALVGDSVNGASRVFGGVWRDNGNGISTLNVNYRITLTMTADPGLTYDIVVNHDLEGVVQQASPGLFNGSCEGCAGTSFSNVAATIVNSGGGVLSGSTSQASAVTTSGTGDQEIDILVGPSSFTLSGIVGSQVVELDFAFTAIARQTNNDDCTSARFGVPFGTGLANECEYGTSASGPGDGHFVTATATVTAVPEAGTVLLLGLGLSGLGLAGRRRAA